MEKLRLITYSLWRFICFTVMRVVHGNVSLNVVFKAHNHLLTATGDIAICFWLAPRDVASDEEIQETETDLGTTNK